MWQRVARYIPPTITFTNPFIATALCLDVISVNFYCYQLPEPLSGYVFGYAHLILSFPCPSKTTCILDTFLRLRYVEPICVHIAYIPTS